MSEQKLKTRRRAPGRTRADRRPTLRRRLFICLLALICLGAGAAGLLSRSTSAQIPVNEPPVAPHDIIVFPSRDFISVSGYVSGEALTASVFHPLSTNADGTFNYDFSSPVSTAHGTADATGTFEVNHPGGFCWETVTPDIRPGDVLRITRADGSADQTTVSNVTAALAVLVQGESAPGAKDGVVQIHGTAQ